MHFLLALVVISLGTLLIKVESVFYLELIANSQIRDYPEAESKNVLFKCAVEGKKQDPHDKLEPPVLCSLVKLRSERDQIYSSKNFWIVWYPRLLYHQEIIFVDTPFDGLPDAIFLAVSYDPLDYPNFEEQNQNGNFGRKPDDIEISPDETYTYYSLSNVGFIQKQYEFIQPGLQRFHQNLKKLVDEYWNTFTVTSKDGRSQKKVLIPQMTRYSPEIVKNNLQRRVSGILTKMIDPCFIKTLVDDVNYNNDKKQSKSIGVSLKQISIDKGKDVCRWWRCVIGRKPSERMSSADANECCNNSCRFLAMAPLVIRKVVDVRCQDLTLGRCAGNTCMCAKSKSAAEEVTMAECNNRVVSVSGTGCIKRFPSPPPDAQHVDIADPSRPLVNQSREQKLFRLSNVFRICGNRNS